MEKESHVSLPLALGLLYQHFLVRQTVLNQCVVVELL
jgi:hypothetical protein